MPTFALRKLGLESQTRKGRDLSDHTPAQVLNHLLSGEDLSLEIDTFTCGELGSIRSGQHLSLRWTGKCSCIICGASTRRLMNGICYNCFQNKAEADLCVMNPRHCHYLQGTCREPAWGRGFCFQPHVVYLSYTGDFKVGITRVDQIPVRWLDQGATWARPLALVGSRHQAGAIEHALTSSGLLSDRTSWKKMLRAGNARPMESEIQDRLRIFSEQIQSGGKWESLRLRVSAPPRAPNAGKIVWHPDSGSCFISYLPDVSQKELKSTNFDKATEVSGRLRGVKGQYLLFEDCVFNVRRHEGYVVEAEV